MLHVDRNLLPPLIQGFVNLPTDTLSVPLFLISSTYLFSCIAYYGECWPCSHFSSCLATANCNTIGGMSVCGKGTLLHYSNCQSLHDGFLGESEGLPLRERAPQEWWVFHQSEINIASASAKLKWIMSSGGWRPISGIPTTHNCVSKF